MGGGLQVGGEDSERRGSVGENGGARPQDEPESDKHLGKTDTPLIHM